MKNHFFICLAIFGLVQAIPSRVKRGIDIQGDPEIEEFFNNLSGNVTKPKEALQKAEEASKKIKHFLDEADEIVHQIHDQIVAASGGEVEVDDKLMKNFTMISSELRQARQELFILAHDTVTLTDDVILFMDHEDELNIYEVNAMLSALKDLLLRTKGQLTNARNKYNNAIALMDKFQFYLRLKLKDMEKYSNTEAEDWDSHCTNLGIGMLILDFLGCFGICSAIFTRGCLADFEEFKQRMEQIKGDIDEVENVVKDSIVGLENEIDIVNRWKSVSDRLQSKLDQKQYQAQMIAYSQRIRWVLVKSVKALKQKAKEFIDIVEFE